MGQQSVRQAARRAAMQGQAGRRRERAERERRLEGLGVDVAVALGERDAAVVEAERRAGQALRRMTDEEGLTVREAVQWCGDEITAREVTRLRWLAGKDATAATADPPATSEGEGEGKGKPAPEPAEVGDDAAVSTDPVSDDTVRGRAAVRDLAAS